MKLCQELARAFSKMEKALDEASLKEFTNCPYHALYLYHFGFGTWIRNCVLTECSPLYRFFLRKGIAHKDDMSDLLMRWFYLYRKR